MKDKADVRVLFSPHLELRLKQFLCIFNVSKTTEILPFTFYNSQLVPILMNF